jgi:4-amino-4-deoxy-L-arabinose transferase
MNRMDVSSRRLGWIVFLAAFAFALAFQGSRGLWEPDEGRYAGIAAEMLRKGDFMVPAFNDEVPHFAKPPMTYWAVAAGTALLGRTEWGARLPNALAFAFTTWLVLLLGRTFVPSRSWLPPLVYATFLFPYAASNALTTDTLLTLWETLAVCGFVRWWEGGGVRHRPLFLMWVGFGLAFLTKGPPGLLPLIALGLFAWMGGGWKAARRLFCLGGLLVFAVLGLGWYALVAITHPGLMEYFIRDEFARRIASGAFHRNPEWYGAFKVYLPTLVLGTLPWTLPLGRAVAAFPAFRQSRPWRREVLRGDPWPAFLALWILFPLALFAISRSRLPLYILPLFIPLALAAARQTAVRFLSKVRMVFLFLWIAALLGLKLAGPLYPYPEDSRALARAVSAQVSPIPYEFVFVDCRPHWGLAYYLDGEVEWATASSAAGIQEEATLADEMADREAETLIITPRDNIPAVGAVLEKMRLRGAESGGTASLVFMRVAFADHPAPINDAKRERVSSLSHPTE